MSLTKPKFEGLSFLVYMLSNFKSPKQAVKNFLNARFCLSLHYKNLTELSFKKKPQQKSSVTKVVQHPLSCFQVCFKFFFLIFWIPYPKGHGWIGSQGRRKQAYFSRLLLSSYEWVCYGFYHHGYAVFEDTVYDEGDFYWYFVFFCYDYSLSWQISSPFFFSFSWFFF